MGLGLWALLVLSGCSYTHTVIRIEGSEIQQRLDERFPIQKKRLMIETRLENPVVLLEPGSDRIGLQLDVSITPPQPLKPLSGRGSVSGKLSYKRIDGAFFFTEPRLETLTLDGKTPDEVTKWREPVEWVTGKALEILPVYRLDREDLKQAAASIVLQDVRVEDGGLNVTLGIGG